MNRVLLLSTLLSVFAVSFSSLPVNNRYGVPHSRNALNHRGGISAPRYPSAPQHPSAPHSPRSPHAPSAPHAYGAPARRAGYGHHQPAPVHQSAPGPYGDGRHFAPSGPGLNHYSGPQHYGAPVPFGGQAHGSAGHFSSAKRSVYQQPQESSSYGHSSPRSGYPQQQNYAHSQQHAQSTAQTHGREMKYTVKDPQNRGTTHVTETHVVSNRQMHGAEAEAAMKKLMGSMGPGSDGGFNDFVKGMGLPFY